MPLFFFPYGFFVFVLLVWFFFVLFICFVFLFLYWKIVYYLLLWFYFFIYSIIYLFNCKNKIFKTQLFIRISFELNLKKIIICKIKWNKSNSWTATQNNNIKLGLIETCIANYKMNEVIWYYLLFSRKSIRSFIFLVLLFGINFIFTWMFYAIYTDILVPYIINRVVDGLQVIKAYRYILQVFMSFFKNLNSFCKGHNHI